MSPDVLVVDLGSGMIKAGWAGEDQPRTCQPMVAARVKHGGGSVGAPGGSDDLLTGLDAIRSVADHGHALELSLPIERGVVHDWNGVQQALASMYAHDLGGIDSDAYSVLVTQSPFASPKQREKLADLLFRQFRVPAILICNSAVLSLFSSGLTTGLVLESGESATYTVPVFEGNADCLDDRLLSLMNVHPSPYRIRSATRDRDDANGRRRSHPSPDR